MEPADRQPVLELQDVEVRYGRTLVVSHASFNVYQGEFVTLLGPSGSGKTSLLRTVAGFVQASAGQIRLRGVSVERVPPYERDVGMVFQNYGLFPHMTVEDNLRFGPRMMKVRPGEIDERVSQALAQVRLEPYRGRYPHELSGGQQQRVAIARALAMRPSLLLLDEPMSNLDARLRAEMRVELVELLKRLGMTAVAVTHNQEEAMGMSDRIVVMAEGGIRQVGTPSDIYRKPSDGFVARFVGDANVLEAAYVGQADGGGSLFRTRFGDWIQLASAPAECRDAKRLLVRPESIRIEPDTHPPTSEVPTNRLVGSVSSAAYMGAFTEVRATVGDQHIFIKRPAVGDGPPPQVGARVQLAWEPGDVKALFE